MSKNNFKGPSANFMMSSNLIQKKSYLSADDAGKNNENDEFNRLHIDDVQKIDMTKLVKFPTNRTYSEENIELLKKDILSEGFNSVIMVAEETKSDPSYTGMKINELESSKPRDGKITGRYIILRGHRRFDALSRAMKEDPSIAPDGCISAYVIEPGLSWDRLKELNMTDNHRVERVSLREQRHEIAELTKLYKKRGLKDAIDRVSQYYSRNKTLIYKSIQISEDLNSEFLDEFDHGFISLDIAVSLSRLSSGKQEEALIIYKKNKAITEDEIQALAVNDHDDTDTVNKKKNELIKAQNEKQSLQDEIDAYYNGNEKDISEDELNGIKKKRDNLTKKIKRIQTCIDELENKPFKEEPDAKPKQEPVNIVSSRVIKMGKSIRKDIDYMSKNISSVSESDLQEIDDIITELQELRAMIK